MLEWFQRADFERKIDRLSQNLEDVVSGLTQLNAAIAALTSAISTNTTDISNALTALANAAPANLTDQINAINAAVQQLGTSDTSLSAALSNPPVTPSAS